MVDTVNMAYHHGSLTDALLDAAVAAARAGGPDAVVLRAATRQVGVSHNAAYRHFADRDALLRAVADRCMTTLGALMRERIAQVPAQPDAADLALARLAGCGRAYIEFALVEPGWFRTAFAVPRPPPSDGDLDAALLASAPFRLLGERLDALSAAGALPAARRPGAEHAAWAAVHGLSMLLLDGPLSSLPASARGPVIDRVLAMVAGGL